MGQPCLHDHDMDFQDFYQLLNNERQGIRDRYLGEPEVFQLFGKQLCNRRVDIVNTDTANRTIKNAIKDGDEVVVVMKNKMFRSVVSLCQITKDMSLKILEDV